MPESCFSYSSDMPPGTGNRDDLSGSPRGRGDVGPCFSYPVGVPLGNLRRMPGGSPSGCFAYPGDAPLGIGNRGIAPRPGCGVRRMPSGPCFNY